MFCNFCFHKYIELGLQNSTLVCVDGSPITRVVKKCGKCGKVKYTYLNIFVTEDWKPYYDEHFEWTPFIETNDKVTDIRKRKLKKLNKRIYKHHQ